MTIVCSECGHQNDDDSDFCSSCGEPLEWTGVRVGAEEPEPAAVPEAVATVVVPPPAPEAPAAPEPPPAPVPEAPPAPAPEAPAAPVAETPAPAAPEEPAKPKKMPRIGRKEKAAAAAAVAPPPPPSAPPGPPPARPATPPPAPKPSAPVAPAPEPAPEPDPPAPAAEAPPGPAPTKPGPPATPPGPTARPPAPRTPAPPIPPVEDEEAEAARLAAEEEERLAAQAKRLVVPVERPPEPVPVVVAPVAAEPEPEKLTWWQRLVRWFKRVILRQKPAAPVVAAAAVTPAAPAAPTDGAAPATPAVGARAPAAQKPGEEVQRKRPAAVREEEPTINPGDLICTQCGTGNSPNNKFCKRCGSSLAEATIAKKPSWWKRFLGFFRIRRRKHYAAGERRKSQAEGGKQKKSFFWIFQSGLFKIAGLATLLIILLAVGRNWRGPLTDRFWNTEHQVHDLVLPSFKHETPVSATASSSLNKAHLPRRAIDKIENDSWISKPTKRDGVLQTITVHFQAPIHLGKIGIRNGDQTTEKTYVNQARLHTALIFFFDKKGKRIVGAAKRCTFDDKPDLQTCEVDRENVSFIKVRAISVYRSQKGNSLAIAEIEPFKKG